MPRKPLGEPIRNFGEPSYTEDQLVGYMKEFAEKHGRPPTARDFETLSRQGLTPSKSTYQDRGGWNHFLQMAGLEIVHSPSEDLDELNKPEYLKRFKEYFKTHSAANMEDVRRDSKKGLCPSENSLLALGGINKLRQYLGIDVIKPVNFSEKEIRFLEGLLAQKNQNVSALEAGYSRPPLSQLEMRLGSRGINAILEIYKKWKSEKNNVNPA